MGFLNGRVTFTRYRVSGASPAAFRRRLLGPGPAARLGRHGCGRPDRRRLVGLGGRRPRARPDPRPGKNVVNDALHLAIRIDTDKIPGSLLRAYTQIEIDARRKLNPSGLPTKAQRQEAKEAARPAPRPRPPTAGSAAITITRSSGTARPRPSTPARPAPASSNGSRPCSARPSTGPSSRSPPGSLARAWPRRCRRPQPGSRPRLEATLSLSGGEQAEASPPSPGPGMPPTASTTWATSSWSGSGTPSRTTATQSSLPTAPTSRSCSPRP